MDMIASQPAARAAPASQPLAWTLPVSGIDCGACALDIERALARVPGVESVEVNPASAWAYIAGHFAEPAEQVLQTLQGALEPLGCALLPDTPAAQLAASTRAVRQALFRLLLAVLVWMQIMMYAWPEYFPVEVSAATDGVLRMPEAPDSLSIALLRWAQWMLSVPLLLYCARPLMRSAWRGLRLGRPNLDLPASVAVLSAFVISTEATLSGHGAVWFDSLSMFLMFLLATRYLAQRMQHQATCHVLAARGDVITHATVRAPDGELIELPADRLKAGDVCRLLQGQALPVDSVSQAVLPVWVSEALLTGEDAAVVKAPGDVLLAGSRLLSAEAMVRVVADSGHSALAALARQAQRAVGFKPLQTRWADRWSLPVLLALLVLSALAAAIGHWLLPQQGWWMGVTVLMVSCPCAISLAGPTASLMAATRLGRSGLVIQNPPSLESLARINHVVFDKTGTLTVGERISALHFKQPAEQGQDLAAWLALCRPSHHPVARAIAAHAVSLLTTATTTGLNPSPEPVWDHWEEIPGEGILARSGSTEYRYTAQGLERRVKGGSWELRASATRQSVLRPGASEVVRFLQSAGIAVSIWSGDHADRVDILARELGIQDGCAGLSPSDKLDRARALREQGGRLLFVGDGINDAPVLASADVSMAMASGSAMSLRQADLVLAATDLGLVRQAIDTARSLERIIRQNMAWAVLYHLVMLPLAMTGALTPFSAGIGMAVSSLGVLLNASRLSRP